MGDSGGVARRASVGVGEGAVAFGSWFKKHIEHATSAQTLDGMGRAGQHRWGGEAPLVACGPGPVQAPGLVAGG